MRRTGCAGSGSLSSLDDAVTSWLAGRVDGVKAASKLLSPAAFRAAAMAGLLVVSAAGVASAADDASFASYRGLPTSMTLGEIAKIGVTMRNTGTSTWTKADGYALVSRNTPSDLWGIGQASLLDGESVAPNTYHSFYFSITAPTTPGEHTFQWQMENGGAAFGAVTRSQTVTVTKPNQAPVVVLAIGDMTLTVGGRSETVNLSSHFQDPEDGVLTYSASSANPAVATTALAKGVLTVTALAAGTTTVTVTATDAGGLTSAPSAFTVAAELPVDVEIPDSNLRTAVELILDKQAGATINSAEMEHLTFLACEQCAIVDLSGLEFATGLGDLQLDDNMILDVAPVSGLPALTELVLSNNPLTDLAALSDAPNLSALDLSETAVSDLSSLSGITRLTRLDLSRAEVTDVVSLSNLTNLTNLSIWENSIKDVSSLSPLVNLEMLTLRENLIEGLSSLANLTKLTSLDLSGNEVRDVSALSGLSNLATLDLERNCLTSIAALMDNTGLGDGDYVILLKNALDAEALAHVSELRQRGATVRITEAPTARLGAPTDVIATPGDRQLTLTWHPPGGAADVPVYEVRWRSATGPFGDWAAIPCSAKGRHELAGLVNGTTYTVELRAAGHTDNRVARVSATPGKVGVPVPVQRTLRAALTEPSTLPNVTSGYGGTEIRAKGAWALHLEDGTVRQPLVYVREVEAIEDPPADTKQIRIRLSTSSTAPVPPLLGTLREQTKLVVHDIGLEEALVHADGSPLVTAVLGSLGSGWFGGRLEGDTEAFWDAVGDGGDYDRSEGLYVELRP